MLTRREFAAGAACLVLTGPSARASYGRKLAPPVEPVSGRTVSHGFIAAERPTALPCFNGAALPLWTFAEGQWPPLIRLQLGDRLDVTLENRLPRAGEHTSIHWHGIRLPNDQDGVPYLVQPPVYPGERFSYSFTPPDTGTYFFHTHCNTVEQLGRGLEGVLIVEGDVTEPYDADVAMLMRDWRVTPDGKQFSSFTTARGAGRAGSYGSLRSVNGAVSPVIPLPASGDCRLRLINTDPTRVMEISIADAEAAVIAIDGIAVEPFPLTRWPMGPAMRLDLVIRAPADGAAAWLVDASGGTDTQLAQFSGIGKPIRSPAFDPAPLRAARLAVPDLGAATALAFRFAPYKDAAAQAAADNLGIPLDSLCLSSRLFWTINDQPWPAADHSNLPPPLAVLERGRTYVLTLHNDSLFSHPIHIHGHFFTVLRSDTRSLPVHHADTLLLLPGEKTQVALVADNPGDWMFHCHIIEHQENGMMGYLRVA